MRAFPPIGKFLCLGWERGRGVGLLPESLCPIKNLLLGEQSFFFQQFTDGGQFVHRIDGQIAETQKGFGVIVVLMGSGTGESSRIEKKEEDDERRKVGRDWSKERAQLTCSYKQPMPNLNNRP